MTVMIWETDVNGGMQEESEVPEYEDSIDDPSHEQKFDVAK